MFPNSLNYPTEALCLDQTSPSVRQAPQHIRNVVAYLAFEVTGSALNNEGDPAHQAFACLYREKSVLMLGFAFFKFGNGMPEVVTRTDSAFGGLSQKCLASFKRDLQGYGIHYALTQVEVPTPNGTIYKTEPSNGKVMPWFVTRDNNGLWFVTCPWDKKTIRLDLH